MQILLVLNLITVDQEKYSILVEFIPLGCQLSGLSVKNKTEDKLN